MYLKELTLRGFKSFASATRFRFEPGITAIVGPNGSGKSNVVDALAWVMGEQGAKSLRGGNMADVIFAGGTARGALGRAQVELTIDNSDGRLPIAYSEVTISRTMFRSGGSEYAINRQPVRLLDVQELLSDSGLGRQMHVIVGQGQLDAVLSASPSDRRAFIDEAAGVAKFRRRKERALRKLESMDANLVRVLDLTAEMKAQLKPLAKQAKAAAQAEGIQRVSAYSQARLLAEDLVEGDERLERLRAQLGQLRLDSGSLEAQMGSLRTAQRGLTQQQEAGRRGAEILAERHRDFTELRGRLVALAELAQERGANAARMPQPVSETSLQLASERALEAERDAEAAHHKLEVAEDQLRASVAFRQETEPRVSEAERALAAAEERLEKQRDSKEKAARDLQSALVAAKSRDGEVAAAQARLDAARERQREAEQREASYLAEHPGEDEGGQGESARYEALSAEETAARQRLQEAERAERDAAEELSRVRSQRETLERSLGNTRARVDAASPTDPAGSWKPLEENLRVDKGWEEAIAAVLGSLVSARVVPSQADYLDAAVSAAEATAQERGFGGYVLAGPADSTDVGNAALPPAGEGVVSARALVRVSPELAPVLDRLLSGVLACEDEAAAFAHMRAGGNATYVTRGGVVLGSDYLRLRGEPQSSRLALLAELEDSREGERNAESVLESARQVTASERRTLAAASQNRAKALSELRNADAARAAVAQERSRLAALAQAAAVEVRRVEHQVDEAERRAQQANAALEAARQTAHQSDVGDAPVDVAGLRLAVSAAGEEMRRAWERENQARVEAQVARQAASSAQQTARAFSAQAQSLREDRERQLDRARKASRAKDVFSEIAALAVEKAERAAELALSARSLRDELRQRVEETGRELTGTAEAIRRVEEERRLLGEELLQAEVAFAGAQSSLEGLQTQALSLLNEHGRLLGLKPPPPPGLRQYLADGDAEEATGAAGEPAPTQEELWDEATQAARTLIAAYGPRIPWDAPTAAHGDSGGGEVFPLSRQEAEESVDRTRRQLARLGVVNPLAVEEYEAASARYRFLEDQVDDLSRSKADLLALMREIDGQVKEAFESAFADTAKKFQGTFSRLFPGGTGRLELTDPADPLTTGVEIFARPSGKRVTRLSLLSGGERSLAALAYLIAIFEARPSPFYVMDEVEAALDDVNLTRVLSLLEDLRAESQLLVITHQKRTMETADALYGVTMKDGVTAVMSHRMTE